METAFIIISAGITIVAFILFIFSLQSYRIYKNTKLPFVIVVFLFFLLRGLLLSIGLFYEPVAAIISSYYLGVLDLAILTLLYLAALKR